jgi:hypothetical protein
MIGKAGREEERRGEERRGEIFRDVTSNLL